MEHIFEKIRQYRIQQNMTLKDLSEKTGLSISFLSQVERGGTSLAITSLQRIAEAFGVPITDFFETSANRNFKVSESDRKPFRIEGSNAVYCRLGGEFSGRSLEPILVTLHPGQRQSDPYTHPGEEFYFVLQGSAVIIVDGKEYRLSQGDSIHFPSTLSHYWFNPSEEEIAQILCVLTPVVF